MNREWRRVPTDCFCGFCMPHRLIKKGEPALYITLSYVKRPRLRCQTCAGETPPDELPDLRESGGIETTTLIRAKREFKTFTEEWMPYRESREPGDDDVA